MNWVLGAMTGLAICAGVVALAWLVMILITPRDKWPWRSPWE